MLSVVEMVAENMTYTLSPSSLNLLEDCPRCFWLYKVKKIQRPNGIFPSLPSGLDHLLKRHFDSYRKRNELPPELQELNGSVELFPDAELLSVWRNNLKGIQYIDKSGMVLRGAVDDILKKGNKLIVLDFKTRGFLPKEGKDSTHYYQDQLDIYNYLLRKNGYATENYAYLLIFTPLKIDRPGNIEFHIELKKMVTDVDHAERLFAKAIKVLSGKAPYSSKECEFCRWKFAKF